MVNIFQGQKIRLRAVEPSDWETHFQWDIDTDGGKLTDEIWFPSSSIQTQAWAEREAKNDHTNDEFRFQIVRLNDEQLVGTINTHTCSPRRGTFMYGLSIAPSYQRQGYASEAIRLVLRYYFHERRYQKVNAEVYAFNQPSIGLHEMLGFSQEGRLRRMIYTQGQFWDALIYGMTKEELEASLATLTEWS